MIVGVISDTHGYADPQLTEIFKDVDCIIHAGDIGAGSVLDHLEAIAPVLAVRGNVDREARLLALPVRIEVSLGGLAIVVVHRVQDACPDAETQIVISGHSHRPVTNWRDRILYLNPGAAGRQGFHRERTACRLGLDGVAIPELVSLGPKSREARRSRRSLP